MEKKKLGLWLVTIAALSFVLYGLIFLFVNFTESSLEAGITKGQVDVDRNDIRAFSHSLDHYLGHLHVSVAVLMISLGLCLCALAHYASGPKAWWTALLALLVTVVPGVAIHFPYGLSSWAHNGPVVLSTLVYIVGAILIKPK